MPDGFQYPGGNPLKDGSIGKRLYIVALLWLCCLAVGAWLSACASQPGRRGLANYQAGHAEERRIVQLTLQLQRAFNAADAPGVLSLYSQDAGMMYDMTGERVGVLLTRAEYAPRLTRKMSKPSYRNCGYLFKFFEPTEIFMDGDEAFMTVPLEVNGTRCKYHEKALFRFEFMKTRHGWRISKSTWEVLASTHPKFKGPGKSR